MAFVQNAEDVARRSMQNVDPTLSEKFATVVRFLVVSPQAASALRGRNAPAIGSAAYIGAAAVNFADGRMPERPSPPKTIPDEMVSVVLETYFDIPEANLSRIKREHALSMGAENIVGNLLERYLCSVLEPSGWVWCSGSMVRAVDFVKPPSSHTGTWRLLQVKNRNNSENSSSSAIRIGTNIEKWHRTFAYREGSNWENFPDASVRGRLSENGFRIFGRTYLRELRESGS